MQPKEGVVWDNFVDAVTFVWLGLFAADLIRTLRVLRVARVGRWPGMQRIEGARRRVLRLWRRAR